MPVPRGTPPKDFNDRAITSIQDFTKAQLERGVRDFGDAVSDLPGFVAGPTPQTPAALPLYGITRLACRTWARGFGPQQLPGFDAAWSGVCSEYLGNEGELPEPGGIAIPFEGGQCPDTYRFTFRQRENDPNGGFRWRAPFTDFYVGPLRIDVVPGLVLGTPGPGLFNNNAALFDGSGVRRITLAAGQTDDPNGYEVLEVFRLNGQLDTCGNPPAKYRDPAVQPGLPPLGPSPITLPGIGDLDIDISFGPDGELIIDFPDIGGSLTLDNPFDPPIDGPGALPPIPGFQGDPGVPVTAEPGEAGEGDDPTKTLTGVLVETLTTPPRSNQIFNPTETYTKGAYFVYLGGDAGLALIDSAAITRPMQFYPAPPGSNRFRVVPNAGFTIRITPYYSEA